MPRIIPIKELKDTAKISEMCHENEDPIYVTKNGYGDMVLMSIESYEALHRLNQIYRELEISEEDVAAGRTTPAKEALKEIREKYQAKL